MLALVRGENLPRGFLVLLREKKYEVNPLTTQTSYNDHCNLETNDVSQKGNGYQSCQDNPFPETTYLTHTSAYFQSGFLQKWSNWICPISHQWKSYSSCPFCMPIALWFCNIFSEYLFTNKNSYNHKKKQWTCTREERATRDSIFFCYRRMRFITMITQPLFSHQRQQRWGIQEDYTSVLIHWYLYQMKLECQ
jgi:hypothetical protein